VNSIVNVLSDREAVAFIGCKNVASIVSKFMVHPEPHRLSVDGLAPKEKRFWRVRDLCMVYEVNEYYARIRLDKLITLGRIAGPVLMR
jgi:hypothetical protein